MQGILHEKIFHVKNFLRAFYDILSEILSAVSEEEIFMRFTAEELRSPGRELYEVGDYEGAIKFYTEILKQNPKSVAAYYFRGLTNYMLAKYEQAIKDLTDAAKFYPELANVYKFRGAAYEMTGDKVRAAEDFKRAKIFLDKF